MSIETMISICNLLKISPNDLLLDQDASTTYDETELMLAALNHCTEKQRKEALALLKLFLNAIR